MGTRQCPHCGTENDVGQSLCSNCKTPLTAYAGELNGEAYKGRLAEQVEAQKTRPLAVGAMSVYLCVIALGWPLRAIIQTFMHRTRTNAEGTNYLASALGVIAPIFMTVLLLPLAILLFWLAWAVWTQRTWAWKYSFAAILIFAGYILIRFSEYHSWVVLWAGLSIALAIFWFQPKIKGWFGLF